MEKLGECKMSGCSTSLEEACTRPKMARKVVTVVEIDKNNVVSGGQRGGTGIEARPGSIAGRKAVMVV